MLTGDNARTAAAIARQCGILPHATDIDAALAAGARLCASLGPPTAPPSLHAAGAHGLPGLQACIHASAD
jgi:magnesium-transporting ATPase (P-type)